MTDTQNIPEPVDGKYIFQISSSVRVRFNADGWVEEIGKGGLDDPVGTKLQGKPGSKRDDVYARRYYDLYTRAVVIDVHPKTQGDQSGSGGVILFKDLEQGSIMYDRVDMIIKIANHHFETSFKPLTG